MLNNRVFYHGSIRRAIIAFGNLFSNIYIDRREGNSVTGPVIQRLQIPISMAPKEKWLVRVEQDPHLEGHTYTTLPRMSFEIIGYSYDSSRKVGKMNKIVCHKDGTSSETFSPVPYNIEIALYVLTKTQEDAMQIIEQILPTFSPEYTVSVNAVPEMGIIQDIPIALNSVSVQDDYDGDFSQRRFVTHTLTFTIKLNLFGFVGGNKPIYHTDVALGNTGPTHIADGDPNTGVITDFWID
jgi:hypothetical protein